MKKTRCHPTKGDTVFCLVGDYAISENLIMANRVLIDAAAIAGVALDGVDNAVFAFFHDAHMVCRSVLAFVLIIPIEKDQVAGARLIAVVPPQSSLPEPLEADGAACEPWDDAGVQIAALVGAPGNKAGAPIHPALEAIPGPIGPTAYIAELGESHRYDLPITCANAV